MTTEERITALANSYDGEGLLAEQVLRKLAWRRARSGKDCANCGEVKQIGDFGRDLRKPDGLEDRCKACEAERNRRRRAATRSTGPLL